MLHYCSVAAFTYNVCMRVTQSRLARADLLCSLEGKVAQGCVTPKTCVAVTMEDVKGLVTVLMALLSAHAGEPCSRTSSRFCIGTVLIGCMPLPCLHLHLLAKVLQWHVQAVLCSAHLCAFSKT